MSTYESSKCANMISFSSPEPYYIIHWPTVPVYFHISSISWTACSVFIHLHSIVSSILSYFLWLPDLFFCLFLSLSPVLPFSLQHSSLSPAFCFICHYLFSRLSILFCSPAFCFSLLLCFACLAVACFSSPFYIWTVLQNKGGCHSRTPDKKMTENEYSKKELSWWGN